MQSSQSLTRITAIGTIFAIMGSAANAQVRWDLADEYGADALTGKAVTNFVSLVEERLGDELEISYQAGGALGYNSADHFDAVQDGAVPSAVTLLTQLGGIDPIFNLSSLPFIAQTPDDAYLLWQAARPAYEEVFEQNGMKLLWAMPNPPSGINAPQPITSDEALAGLRIRTYDVNGTQTMINAGAAPLQVAWSDLIPQLSTGGIDAVLTSADGARQLSLWDYVSDFTELNYAMGLFVMHVNQDSWDQLSDEAQTTLMDMIPEIDEANWKLMEASIQESYDIMEENGMTVTLDDAVPQEVFNMLQEAGAPVREEWLDATGKTGEQVLSRYEGLRSEGNN